MKCDSNAVNIAINDGNISTLNSMFESNPKLLTTEYSDVFKTPLHYCAAHGNLETFIFLVNKGLNVNISIKGHETPLHCAAINNKLDIVRWLLDNGAWVDGIETSILTPMMSAVTFGHLEIVKILVENFADVNRMHIRNGMLPLDISIARGHDEISTYLKNRGAQSQYILPDWVENEIEGSGILSYVTLHADKILPIDICSSADEIPVTQKLTRVNKKKNRMLFTFGLFKLHTPPIELFIVLPEYWNFYVSSAENQFPILLLSQLTKLIKNGLHIEEGYHILKDDINFNQLKWPNGISGLFVSDVKWKNQSINNSEYAQDDQTVYLYSLVPIKSTKNGFSKQSLIKNRDSGWLKLCLKIEQT